MNTRQANSADNYLGAYRRISEILPGHHLPWLQQARSEAIERFARRGFPTLRDENWKYTSVAGIEQSRYNVLPAPCPYQLASQVASHALPGAHLLVFVNGQLEPGLSSPGHLPPGATLSSLAYWLEGHPDELERSLISTDTTSAFADLNLAFASDGAYLHLAPQTRVEAPIQLLFMASEANLAIQHRSVILAAAGSSACIIEQHVALDDSAYLTNAQTSIAIDAAAEIEHLLLQQESPAASHIAGLHVQQQANSRFVSASHALGSRLARVDIAIALQGEGASCDLDGLYLGSARQHLDHHTCVDHRQPGGTSRQLYKGVLSGAARGVFNGRIVVHADAQRSDATQTNRNLLLSENTEIDSKPQLEIWADDVKCSHAATVGQLDEEQLFYLRSRGIGLASARSLLSRAFAREMIDRVRLPVLQERLDALLQEKLGAMAC
ncbi:MAG: Fe-S cluster assembly protein SufD [Azonexus sp.]